MYKSRINRKLSLFAVLMMFIGACKKQEPSIPEFHYEYYPLEKGTFVVYDAMEISHDVQALVARDTNRFFLKTLIGDSIIDNSGNVAYQFLRFKKQNLEDEWQLSDVWTTRIVNQRMEVVEENQRIVKLVFAPTKEKAWDINSFNNEQPLIARYNPELLHVPKVISNISLDSTLQVEIQDFFSLVDHRRKFEVYAKGIGLVYRSFKDNAIMNFDTLDIRLGREVHYRMIDYGKE
jgi:hypothetical protein